MRTVKIRELKAKLSAYLRMVAAGESIYVTDRDEIVAQLSQPRFVQSEATDGPSLRLAACGARPPLRKRGDHDYVRPHVATRLSDARIDTLLEDARNESR